MRFAKFLAANMPPFTREDTPACFTAVGMVILVTIVVALEASLSFLHPFFRMHQFLHVSEMILRIWRMYTPLEHLGKVGNVDSSIVELEPKPESKNIIV